MKSYVKTKNGKEYVVATVQLADGRYKTACFRGEGKKIADFTELENAFSEKRLEAVDTHSAMCTRWRKSS